MSSAEAMPCEERIDQEGDFEAQLPLVDLNFDLAQILQVAEDDVARAPVLPLPEGNVEHDPSPQEGIAPGAGGFEPVTPPPTPTVRAVPAEQFAPAPPDQDDEIEAIYQQIQVECQGGERGQKRSRSPEIQVDGVPPPPKRLCLDTWATYFFKLLRGAGIKYRNNNSSQSCLYRNVKGDRFAAIDSHLLSPPTYDAKDITIAYEMNPCAISKGAWNAFVQQMGNDEYIIHYDQIAHSGAFIITMETNLLNRSLRGMPVPVTWSNHLFGPCRRYRGLRRTDAEGSSTLHHAEGALSVETVTPYKKALMQANPRRMVEMMKGSITPCTTEGKINMTVPLSNTNEFMLVASSPVTRKLKEQSEYSPHVLMVRWTWSGTVKLMEYLYGNELKDNADYTNMLWESSFVSIDKLMSLSVNGRVLQLFRDGGEDYALLFHLMNDVPLVL